MNIILHVNYNKKSAYNWTRAVQFKPTLFKGQLYFVFLNGTHA